MPAAVEEPSRPEAPAAAAPDPRADGTRPAHTAEPEASDPRLAQRRAPAWRHLLIAAVLGAVVGAAIPGGLQLAERASAGADRDSLRDVAMTYLTAIAEGRAADAGAMVPLPAVAREIPDAVLQAAERLTEPSVRLVHIDGDTATLEVEYLVGRSDRVRALGAERVDGQWQITTTLAERVTVNAYSGGPSPRIAGIEIPFGLPVHLYPGIYAFDDQEDPMLSSRSSSFPVDGDPATLTEAFVEVALVPEVEREAQEIAVRVAEQCRAEGSCEVAEGELQGAGATYLMGITPTAFDLGVSVAVGGDLNGQWFEVRMRVERDAEGAPGVWLCAPLDSMGSPTEPCPTR